MLLRVSRAPLSLAVFGPPGSGKMFPIREVVRTLASRRTVELVYDLAQFTSPTDLVLVFHAVRDEVLNGRIPLVVFQEFDTALDHQVLGWLRHFLMPMQDGIFSRWEQIPGDWTRDLRLRRRNIRLLRRVHEPQRSQPRRGSYRQKDRISFPDSARTSMRTVRTAPDRNLLLRRAVLLRGILESKWPAALR